MDCKRVSEFLNDNRGNNIFSYDDYLKSSFENKIKMIKLLNEYYNILLNDSFINVLPVYVDFDGVIKDTIKCASKLLLDMHDIDYYTHSRTNVDQDKIVGNFFRDIDWNYLLDNSDEINYARKFLTLMNESIIYKPIIYSAFSSEKERKVKKERFSLMYPGINSLLLSSKYFKECTDKDSVLIDDSDHYLVNWEGKPIHFNSGSKSIFYSISDLGEIFYLFPFCTSINKAKNVPWLYDGFKQEYDIKKKRLVWNKK